MPGTEACPWQENPAQRSQVAKSVYDQTRHLEARWFWYRTSPVEHKVQSEDCSRDALLPVSRNHKVWKLQFQVRRLVSWCLTLWDGSTATPLQCVVTALARLKDHYWQIQSSTAGIQLCDKQLDRKHAPERPRNAPDYPLDSKIPVNLRENKAVPWGWCV